MRSSDERISDPIFQKPRGQSTECFKSKKLLEYTGLLSLYVKYWTRV